MMPILRNEVVWDERLRCAVQIQHRGPDPRTTRHPSWRRTDGRCYYCGQPAVVLDHIVSRRDGGSDGDANLIPACWHCNCAKHARTVDEYRIYCQRLAAGAPAFTVEQVDYLAAAGVALPALPPYEFWGEAHGIPL